ncbi:MAG: T9SS type A sorting domain-containing protein, partial [Flavobacteriales bacterium]
YIDNVNLTCTDPVFKTPSFYPQHTTQNAINEKTLIIDQKTNYQTAVFPNPNKGSFKLTSSNSIENGILMIRKLTGEILFEKTISGNEWEMALPDISSGIYLIQTISDQHSEIIRLVIE